MFEFISKEAEPECCVGNIEGLRDCSRRGEPGTEAVVAVVPI